MTKKALLIGINYTGTNNALAGCINDIYNVRNVLNTYFQYSNSNIKVLSDKDILPTKKNIMDHINWLVSDIKEGDSLFFHYSGHGSYVSDTNGDESDRRDEVVVPLDFQTTGFITDDWLYSNFIRKIPKQVSLWVLMDCCHSGTILDLKHNYKSLCKLKQGQLIQDMPYVGNQWSDMFNYSIERSQEVQGNVCMFSGCRDNQTAADAWEKNLSQGAFTFCFLECIRNNTITNADGTQRLKPTLNLRDMLKEINCLLKIHGYPQETQLSVSSQTYIENSYNP